MLTESSHSNLVASTNLTKQDLLPEINKSNIQVKLEGLDLSIFSIFFILQVIQSSAMKLVPLIDCLTPSSHNKPEPSSPPPQRLRRCPLH